MIMHPTTSTNVRAVGYEPSTRTMRVQFRSGGVYEYHDIDPLLFEEMLGPHPWRRVGRTVKKHRYTKIS